MKHRILNLGLFSRYRQKIGEKNYFGLFATGIVFAVVIIGIIIGRLLTAPQNIHWFYLFFVLLDAIALIILRYTYRNYKKAVGYAVFFFYIFFYGVLFYTQFMESGPTNYLGYFLVSVLLSTMILNQPVSLLVGQVAGAVTVCLGASISKPDTKSIEFSNIGIICLISIIAGLIIGYIRLENLIFEDEVLEFANGEGDEFVTNTSDPEWSGRNKYGILSGEANSTRKVFSFVFSVSTGKLLKVREYNIFGLKEGMEWSEVRSRILSKVINPIYAGKLSRLLDLDTLAQMGKVGKRRTSVLSAFDIDDGTIIWTDIECILRAHPITDELIARVIVEDITEERILMGVLNRIVESNYDSITCLEKNHNRTIRFEVVDGEEICGKYTDDYSKIVNQYIKAKVADRDVERATELFKLENVEKALSEVRDYAFLVNEKNENGKTAKKMFQYSFLDRGRHFICILKQDVTTVIENEDNAKKRLSKALEERENAMNTRDDFMTKMSHEMRTPMNAILGISSLMEDEINNPNAMRGYIKKVEYSGNFLLQLINDVLDMSKMEQGKFNVEHVPYSFGEFWESINTMIVPMCISKSLDFEWKSSINDNRFVYTDPLRLTQVFMNLISNAIKYTPEGGHIVFECKEKELEDDYVRATFIVKDDGIGMSHEFMDHLFEPFAQESKDVKSNLNGTGLGLPIVKGIVEAMGGKITVKSEQGVGTTFRVTFEFEIAKEFSREKESVEIKDLTGKRILVVEDNEINREIAVALIKKKGMLAEVAENGQEAVEQFTSHAPGYYDVILMDIRMPVMSGLTATKRIRAMEREDGKTIPIVAMTANAFIRDVEASFAAGLNEHLSKPIVPNKLYETISKFV